MPKLLNKLILSFLTSLIVLFSLAPYFTIKAEDPPPAPTAAPASWYNQSFTTWYAKVYDENVSPSNEIFGERYTAAQVQWVVYSLVAFLVNSSGEAGTRAVSCMMSGNLNSCGGAIEEAVNSVKLSDGGNQTIASAFSVDQISGVGYMTQKIRGFHLIPEANAQGFGYFAANPVQKLWIAIRNLTFGLIILVVISMAFMIMFRVKISPQAVITVQSALPKIIIALILISFSYAIAGFAIDIMYVVMGMLSTFITSSGISSYSAPELFAFFRSTSVLGLIFGYLVYFFLSFFGIFSTLGASAALGIGATGNGVVAGGVVGGIVGSVLGVIILIVMTLVLLWASFKIMWLLLKTYVNILLKIIFGPIQILLGVISSSGGFGAWLKELAADLSIFPVVSFLFFLSFFFLAQSFKLVWQIGTISESVPIIGGVNVTDFIISSFPFKINPGFLSTTATWVPPLTVGVNGLGLLWLGASFAVMALIPKTGEIIKGLISGKPFPYGTAIGETTAVAGTVGLGMANRESAAQQAAYAKALKTGTPSTWQDRANEFWSFIRGVSAGKIK